MAPRGIRSAPRDDTRRAILTDNLTEVLTGNLGAMRTGRGILPTAHPASPRPVQHKARSGIPPDTAIRRCA